jgi:hypothetical protein
MEGNHAYPLDLDELLKSRVDDSPRGWDSVWLELYGGEDGLGAAENEFRPALHAALDELDGKRA